MENTKIGWTDHTVNFWTGCTKVSEGCKFCYMYRDKERYGKDPKELVKTNIKTVNKVLRTAKAGDKIFTCSWSDFFIEGADEWRAEAWDIIRKHPQFIWQILTKRPERIKECLPPDWGANGWANVWLGTTCENQKTFDDRYPYIAELYSDQIENSCKNFISFEPLLEPINLQPYFHRYKDADGCSNLDCLLALDWMIVGGESGNEDGKYLYRPCEIEWIDEIVNWGRAGDIPVFVKQTGTHIAKIKGLKDRHGADFSELKDYQWTQDFPN